MGVPEVLSCDGGQNLTSFEVREWLKGWGVRLRVSGTHYPKSNGRAECAVKVAKHLVANNITASDAFNMDKFLYANLAYRNSTIYPDTSKSVTQSLLGRHLRDSLPNVC